MTLTQLLFSFKGRINRLPWWVASLAVGGVAAIVTTILEMAARSTGHAVINPDTQQWEPAGIYGLVLLAVTFADLWINFALAVKRLHDRDRSGWWLVLQAVSLLLAVFFAVLAIAFPQELGLTFYILAGILGFVAIALSIWLLVELGFLRGTPGPNRFGPDPLGVSRADATL